MDVEWPEDPMVPEIKKELSEDYTELLRTGHNLRRRDATDFSPYLAPWQQERQRRQQSKADVKIQMEDETEDEPGTPKTLANIPLAEASPRPWYKFEMLLQAAALLDAEEIRCTSFGCPITEPHGEGLYQYAGEVPNSDLANQFFAPSIPPPSVVEAFNSVLDRPTLNSLYMKDYFFEYHTAPCRPSKYLSKVWKTKCKSKHCGVQEPHNKGAYLHKGIDANRSLARRVDCCFGISNPPPTVWDAALRIVEGKGTGEDQELVDDFSAHHVRFDHGGENVAAFQRWQKQRMSERS
ncbi:MAG: hypothetical protein LQ338_007786 [Usnochroma carphineum]|nr:MAG: hypothetical protein LQ338_007786 [Usnochroma carphineum]